MLGAAALQYDAAMQGQAQAAADQGMALRYVGSLDLVKMTCTVELKVMPCWRHPAAVAYVFCPLNRMLCNPFSRLTHGAWFCNVGYPACLCASAVCNGRMCASSVHVTTDMFDYTILATGLTACLTTSLTASLTTSLTISLTTSMHVLQLCNFHTSLGSETAAASSFQDPLPVCPQ